MMDEVLARLQNVEIIEVEEEFFLLSPKDVVASAEENNRSSIGKLIADRDVNIQNLRQFVCCAWRKYEFKICKLDVCSYQFYFQNFDMMMVIVVGGPWMWMTTY